MGCLTAFKNGRFTFLKYFFISLVGCSSLHREAKEAFEAGKYDAALEAYTALVKQDSQDDDAIIGLQKTREKLLDIGLLKVRRIRLEGKTTQSIDALLELVRLENEWKFFPKDRVMFTQEEETKEAYQIVNRMVDEALRKDQPLRGSYFIRNYEPVFQGQMLQLYERKKAEITKRGENSCKEFANGNLNKKPFLAGFLKKYCTHWGVAHRSIANSEDSKAEFLFRDVGLDLMISGIPKEALADFREDISWGLKQTPWYDPTAKKILRLSLQGDFQNQHLKKAVPQQHHYTISVPYTEYVTVQRSRQVPVTRYRQQCSYTYGGYQSCYSVPYTDYETEYYSSVEPRIAYKQVPQVQPYMGYVHAQRLGISVNGGAILDGKTLPLKISEVQREESFSHDTDMPNIGLYPEEPELEDPLMFVKYQARELGKRFESSLKNEWKARYCRALSAGASSFSDGDTVIRCLKIIPVDPPLIVDKWFSKNFGLTAKQADHLLGLNDRK
jgi:hypothetical protein